MLHNTKKLLISISGPTASGKTAASLQLAKHFNTEIISCDSRQMYREMKIGTAVPDKKELAQCSHHFIGKLSIHDYYNASMFEIDITNLLKTLFNKHNIVIMTGGSGMYLDAVLYGIDKIPDPDMNIREALTQRYNNEGLEPLRFELRKLDPDCYEHIDKKNHKRVIRALEVCLSTGKPFSSFHTRTPKKRDFDVLLIGLNKNRTLLYHDIDTRIDNMLEKGLEEEARKLYPHKGLVPLKTIGYTEFFRYFDKEISKEQAIQLIRKNTRQYARKQINWQKRYKVMHWFEYNKTQEIIHFIEQEVQS
ncbi:MAG: tRNA (adenosine(37)-N6)-dimethylallyltransferase MiaA [Bacteroidota bacterium]|nr:tRNA (adenosine(37)-N6)-dimethylallyltransferase MiaA [Bacteroidota bacterium]